MPTKITPQELNELLRSDNVFALIDVRERKLYESGQILGASNIPRNLIESKIPIKVPLKSTKIILYCGMETMAGYAARTLEHGGYTNVHILSGGLAGWSTAGFPTVRGVHVLSKTFGEIVGELQGDAVQITPAELKDLLDRNEDVQVIDVRPRDEVDATGSIPGAINIPGVELPLKIQDYFLKGKKLVLTCAGRTRGIIASATIKRLGFPQVYDLKNGTLNWQLEGLPLEKEIPGAKPPSAASRQKAGELSKALAVKSNIQRITPAQLLAMKKADGRALYVFDVRTKFEYILRHIPGSIHCPGGQAIQNTDDAAVVHNADIVFVCDDGTRCDITAYWYGQCKIPNVYTLTGGIKGWLDENLPVERGMPKSESLNYNEALDRIRFIAPSRAKRLLTGALGPTVIDVGDGRAYALGHLSGAVWLPRARLEERVVSAIPKKDTGIIVTSASGYDAVFAAKTLGELGYHNVLALRGGRAAWTKAELTIITGPDGAVLDDWQTHLTEYGEKEAREYFEWEESLLHLPEYMSYFKEKNII